MLHCVCLHEPRKQKYFTAGHRETERERKCESKRPSRTSEPHSKCTHTLTHTHMLEERYICEWCLLYGRSGELAKLAAINQCCLRRLQLWAVFRILKACALLFTAYNATARSMEGARDGRVDSKRRRRRHRLVFSACISLQTLPGPVPESDWSTGCLAGMCAKLLPTSCAYSGSQLQIFFIFKKNFRYDFLALHFAMA